MTCGSVLFRERETGIHVTRVSSNATRVWRHFYPPFSHFLNGKSNQRKPGPKKAVSCAQVQFIIPCWSNILYCQSFSHTVFEDVLWSYCP